MNMMIAPLPKQGPFAFENWKAAIAGIPSQSATEYPLFTDAQVIGEITSGYGPYQLLNTVPIPPDSGINAPAIVLRVEYHLQCEYGMQKMKTNVDRYHGGFLKDEIAALVSLCLGIRLMAGGSTRRFELGGDPRGHPEAHEIHDDPVLPKSTRYGRVLPNAVGAHSLTDTTLLKRLPDLSPDQAIALVRAARLYQDGLWIVESEPELTWIMLVSAIEIAANQWRKTEESPTERLRASRIGPELEKLLNNDVLFSEVATLLNLQ